MSLLPVSYPARFSPRGDFMSAMPDIHTIRGKIGDGIRLDREDGLFLERSADLSRPW